MIKTIKYLSIIFFTAILICTFFIQGYATKYIDGRFITNIQIHEFVCKLVESHEDYKEIPEAHSICFERIKFSFTFNKQNDTVKKIGLYVPVIDQDSVITFYIGMFPKKNLHIIDLVNLFLISNEFNEYDFDFTPCDCWSIQDWYANAVNKYDYKYSIFTDITEENWHEKFSDEESVIPELCPDSLMFFEIHPGDKVFVQGRDENLDE